MEFLETGMETLHVDWEGTHPYHWLAGTYNICIEGMPSLGMRSAQMLLDGSNGYGLKPFSWLRRRLILLLNARYGVRRLHSTVQAAGGLSGPPNHYSTREDEDGMEADGSEARRTPWKG